jgi:hypothetical protein
MDEQQGVVGVHDPRLQTPLLRHPGFSQDQQIVAALQQTSKELHAAVAARLAGQLPVVLCTKQLRHAQAFVQWLGKHASLLQSLHLQLPRSHDALGRPSWPAAAGIAAGLADALQHAATSGALQLQSFELAGVTAGTDLLQQLPAAQLTKLCIGVDFSSSASLQAVAGLTSLRHLELCNTAQAAATTAAAIIPDDVLAPVAAGLQQLTQLHLKPVRSAQLQWLPAELQQLHVTVELCNQPQQLLQLASWLQQHVSIVQFLELQGAHSARLEPGWGAAMQALTDAFQAATEAGTAPPAAVAAAAAAAADVAATAVPVDAAPLQLQSLLCGSLAAPVPQHLPVSTLTELACQLDWSRTAHVSTVCSLTNLQKLDVLSVQGFTSWQADNVLAPLSALQRLTSLQLDYLSRRKLEHSRMPQLLELTMRIEMQHNGDAVQLQMGHLTGLSKLTMSDWAATMQLEDQLPPGLQDLGLTVVLGVGGGNRCNLQPLLQLSRLQKLRLQYRGVPLGIGEAMRQLSSVSSLQEFHLACNMHTTVPVPVDPVGTLGRLTGLPLKSLAWTSADIHVGSLQSISHLQGLTSLELSTYMQSCGQNSAAPGQLAAVLQPLTELRRLRLDVYGRVSAFGGASIGPEHCSSSGSHATAFCDDMEDVAALLRCVGGLRKVEELRVTFVVRLQGSDVQKVQAMMQQLLPSYMLPFCKVQAAAGFGISIEL